ncbi:hypothetical protein [Micrococcus sp.]|uniref:hypothetical protein n=1 Tax=Micrococcus sp. TaxID=1271 RepID=UPI0026DBAC62|nr:hypothetical protein [Micrococcus sp.]MDO4239567.1 hypothetical protein [Micrococcus sp.]
MTRLLPGDSLTLDLAPEDPADLLARLRAAGVAMNESAERLVAERRMRVDAPARVTVVERTLADLGLPDGGTLPELRRAVEAAGLRECPPAVAPLLRMATLDQANAPDSVLRHGHAPDGSAHVLSPSLGDESGVHRGLYLRVVDHAPWLRGFACDDLHVFGPEDRWILAR